MRVRFSVSWALLALTCLPGGSAVAQTVWTGTWAAAPSAEIYRSGVVETPTTMRQIVHLSRGGTQLRVTFSNELGSDSLIIAGAHLALRTQGSDVAAGSDRVLSFGGEPSITLPPGAVAVSDPVAEKVAPLSDLAISILLPPQPLHIVTAHSLGLQTNFEVAGDQLTGIEMRGAKPFAQWRFLKNVEVSGGERGAAIVALGDSITDGHRSTPDTNRRWPDILARRLQADRKLAGLGVLNEGISGNRVLHNNAGPNALARFDRDVLSQSDVRYVVVMEGINDIGRTDQPNEPGDPITAQQLIVGYEQIIARAHAHGIKVYGATLTPFLGAGYATAAGETMRQTVNAWIRQSGHFDAVLDFDKVTRDPAQPGSFSSTADSGDHLHPGDAGYAAMANSINLALFGPELRELEYRKQKARRTAGPCRADRTDLLEFIASEKVADLKGGRLFPVGTVDRVLFDGIGEHLADGAFLGVGGVGGAHQLAQIGNGIFFLKHHREDGTGGHELGQRAEEWPCRMHMVEALRLILSERNLLDGDDLKSGLFDLRENGAGKAFADRVRLDNAKGALGHKHLLRNNSRDSLPDGQSCPHGAVFIRPKPLCPRPAHGCTGRWPPDGERPS